MRMRVTQRANVDAIIDTIISQAQTCMVLQQQVNTHPVELLPYIFMILSFLLCIALRCPAVPHSSMGHLLGLHTRT